MVGLATAYLRNLFTDMNWDSSNVNYLSHEKIKSKIFTDEDTIKAISESSFSKALGEDWFDV